jgi:hypothetical protein
MLWVMRRLLSVLTVLGALASAAVAVAAVSDKEQHKFTAADQKAAKKSVIVKGDLSKTGWTGGAKKPDLSPIPTCANFNPKQSDLVVTGAAETDWKHSGLELDTEAQVLQTADMVERDWQRTVADPHALSCTAAQIKKNFSGSASVKFRAYKRVPFPAVGTHARAFITRIDVASNGKALSIAIEDVLVTNGRTEISLTSTTSADNVASVAQVDIELAQLLAKRSKA